MKALGDIFHALIPFIIFIGFVYFIIFQEKELKPSFKNLFYEAKEMSEKSVDFQLNQLEILEDLEKHISSLKIGKYDKEKIISAVQARKHMASMELTELLGKEALEKIREGKHESKHL